MDIQKFERDFLYASAKTAITVMNANGWEAGIVNAASVNVDSVFLYAFDQQTAWTCACSVPRQEFLDFIVAANAMPKKDRDDFPTICSHVVELAREASFKRNEKSDKPAKPFLLPSELINSVDSDSWKIPDIDIRNSLGFALSAYISTTKSYAMTEDATKANHFVVIRYGASDRLRPFVLKGPERYLGDVEEIHKAINYVMDMDSKNHPEWVSGTSIDPNN